MELTAGNFWVMISAALVLLMTPGLAFFYGGMAQAKSAVNMIMMSFVSVGLVGGIWVLWGYSMTGGDGVAQLFGNRFAAAGLAGLVGADGLINAGFGATFAIITVALISGVIADRTRFPAWSLFVPLFVTLVYCPMAFIVWSGACSAKTVLWGRLLERPSTLLAELSAPVPRPWSLR